MPLLPKYQAALDQLQREQAAIDLKSVSGAFRNKARDVALNVRAPPTTMRWLQPAVPACGGGVCGSVHVQ
jgi:hypothetical protein